MEVTKELWETIHAIEYIIEDYNAGLISHEELIKHLGLICSEYRDEFGRKLF